MITDDLNKWIAEMSKHIEPSAVSIHVKNIRPRWPWFRPPAWKVFNLAYKTESQYVLHGAHVREVSVDSKEFTGECPCFTFENYDGGVQ